MGNQDTTVVFLVRDASLPGIDLPYEGACVVILVCPLINVSQEGVTAADIPSLHARLLHDDGLTSRVCNAGSVSNEIVVHPVKVRGRDAPVVCNKSA